MIKKRRPVKKNTKKSKYKNKKTPISKEKHIKENGAYFNIKNRYKTGIFISKKNQSKHTYRSSFEFAYLNKLENDKNVIKYITEPFSIPYIDSNGLLKNYIPDVLVLYSDGSIFLYEIKPKAMINASNVRRKATKAIQWLKNNYPDVKYKFITEDEIFNSDKDYKKLLKDL